MRQRIHVILNCQLFELLRGRNLEQLTSEQLRDAFEELQSLLQEVTDGKIPYSEKYRILTFVTAYVNGINAPPKGCPAKSVIKILKECVKGENELLQSRILYPSLFTQQQEITISPLHWNISKFSKRDLIELVSALFASDAIVDSSGNSISYTQLIKHISERLNIPISAKSAYKERDYIINIKQNPSAFIEQLARSLEEK